MRLLAALLALLALLTSPVAAAAGPIGCGGVGDGVAGVMSAAVPCAMARMTGAQMPPAHPAERQHAPAGALCAQACCLIATVPAPAIVGSSAAPWAEDAVDHPLPRPLIRPGLLAAGVDHPPKSLV